MSIHTEVLCLAEGLEGPVVLSVKGSTGAAFTGKEGVFAQAKKALVVPAEKALKKKVPLYAFWLPISQAVENGKPAVKTFTQGSHVTPPALTLPDLTGRDLLNGLYAGREVIEKCAALYQDYQEWKRTKRGDDPVANVAPAPVHAGHNAPQELDPLTDDDIL